MVTSVNPTTCSTFVKGLGCGAKICEDIPAENIPAHRNKINFFIVLIISFLKDTISEFSAAIKFPESLIGRFTAICNCKPLKNRVVQSGKVYHIYNNFPSLKI